jgi:ribosomal 50S subunit-recycling heat shock protein
MRIDQYLKIARLVKRRPVSKALADQQRVLINGKAAKPAADVKIGDTVDLYFGHRHLQVKVLELADSIKKAQSMTLYEILIDERIYPTTDTESSPKTPQ